MKRLLSLCALFLLLAACDTGRRYAFLPTQPCPPDSCADTCQVKDDDCDKDSCPKDGCRHHRQCDRDKDGKP